jgi:hypothetical protein
MVFKVPEAILKEYAERLKEITSIKVSASQICRFLANEEITLKNV